MTYLKGVDVSKYQTVSDWAARPLDFLVARASIGTTPDLKYADHIAKAKALGLVTGAYHFNWDQDYSGTADPLEQARFFVKAAGDVDLLFLDVEGAMAFEERESTAFIAEVHRLGKKVGLYMSRSVFRNDGQDYDWIAAWGSTLPTWTNHVEFWQYSSGGLTPDGGRIDLDYFNGTKAALLALSNKETDMTPKTITTQTPLLVDVPINTACYDLDGKTALTHLSVGLTGRYSPFGAGTQRAIYVTTGGIVRPVLVTPTKTSPIIDPTPLTKAQLDAAVAVQASANDAEVATLKAQLDAATAAAAAAATTERERIADVESSRIRSL